MDLVYGNLLKEIIMKESGGGIDNKAKALFNIKIVYTKGSLKTLSKMELEKKFLVTGINILATI
jgi:hypothetical protein